MYLLVRWLDCIRVGKYSWKDHKEKDIYIIDGYREICVSYPKCQDTV